MAMSILDVTDPTKPELVYQAEVPHNDVRGNSLAHPRRHAAAGQPVQAVRPAAGRLHGLRPVRPGPAARGRLLRHVGAALAGRPLRLADGRPLRPHHHRRRRLRAEPPQGPPVLHDRRPGGPGQPARGRALVAARPAQGRPGRPAEAPRAALRLRLPPAQHARASRSARTAPTWATSTAASSSWTSRTRASRNWSAGSTTTRRSPASPTPSCRCSSVGC